MLRIAKWNSTHTRQPQEHFSRKDTKPTDGSKRGKGTGHPKGKMGKRKEKTKQMKAK